MSLSENENEQNRTLYVGNLDDRVTETLLTELFIQSGPLESICIPNDKISKQRKNFAFVTFKHSCSVPYTIQIMSGIQLFGKSLDLQFRPNSIHLDNQNKMQLQRSYSAPNTNKMENLTYCPDINLSEFTNLKSDQFIQPPLSNFRDRNHDKFERNIPYDSRSRFSNKSDRSRSRERRQRRY